VANVRCEDGGDLFAVWISRAVLIAQWEQAAPRAGDRVAIAYDGMKEGREHAYHAYGVEVERVGETIDLRFPEPDDGHDKRPAPTLDDPNSLLPY
jgi:hypothetical protein